MKKLFTLFVMAMIAIGANAQILIAEKDFTGGFEGDYPYDYGFLSSSKGSVSSDADGVAITNGTSSTGLWGTRLTVFPEGSYNLKPDGNYIVVVTAKFPTNGMVAISIGNMASDASSSSAYVTANGDFQEIEVGVSAFGDLFYGEGCYLVFYCGEFFGTTILKKVQVYEMEDAGEKVDGITYLLNKTSKTAEVKVADWDIKKADIPTTISHEGEEYTVTKILDRAFSGCSLTSVTIPNSVTSINYDAFEYNYGLEEIAIPASVIAIGPYAFRGCSRLKRVTVLAEIPPVLYENAFSNYNMTLKVPDASIDVYKTTEPWSKFSEFELLSKEKCATPTISVEDGKLNFSCETEGVEYHYEIFTSIKGDGNGIKIPETLKISVYASKEGWYDSAIETAEIPTSVVADANGDGVVNAADIVKIANVIMGQ